MAHLIIASECVGAWLVLATIAFNLTRAAGTLASTFHAKATTGTIRTQLIAVPARLARPAGYGCICPATGPGNTPGPNCSTPPADHLPRPDPDHRPDRARPVEEPDRPAAHPCPSPAIMIESSTGGADQDRRWIEAEPRRMENLRPGS